MTGPGRLTVDQILVAPGLEEAAVQICPEPELLECAGSGAGLLIEAACGEVHYPAVELARPEEDSQCQGVSRRHGREDGSEGPPVEAVLFLARLAHDVVHLDEATTGLAEAEAEGLPMLGLLGKDAHAVSKHAEGQDGRIEEGVAGIVPEVAPHPAPVAPDRRHHVRRHLMLDGHGDDVVARGLASIGELVPETEVPVEPPLLSLLALGIALLHPRQEELHDGEEEAGHGGLQGIRRDLRVNRTGLLHLAPGNCAGISPALLW